MKRCYFAHGGKVTKTPPGTTPETRAFPAAFSPDPLVTGVGGIAAFGRCKICFMDHLPVVDLKSALFYGGYLNAHRRYGKT